MKDTVLLNNVRLVPPESKHFVVFMETLMYYPDKGEDPPIPFVDLSKRQKQQACSEAIVFFLKKYRDICNDARNLRAEAKLCCSNDHIEVLLSKSNELYASAYDVDNVLKKWIELHTELLDLD